VEGFDSAFHNRIHVKIKYDGLSPESRGNIWRNLLTKSRRRPKIDESWSEQSFRTFGKLETNGRDIRNIIRTAYGIANSREEPLGVQHVVRVIRNNFSGQETESIVREVEELKED
jgi:hypothetical protein